MIKEKKEPTLIFQSSWEVCNKIGGIYTVLSTQANTLQNLYKDKVIYLGPDMSMHYDQPDFEENLNLLSSWKSIAEKQGLKIKIGRWNISGNPIAVLIDFNQYFEKKNEIYTNLWSDFGVDSIHAYGDYDESCMFAYACGKVIESFVKFKNLEKAKIIAHFHEWMLGAGLLYCKKNVPEVSTVFTTHATSIGRSICGNNKPLYSFLKKYNGDVMARELNMESKHSLEKITAREADGFTTVSDITGRECKELLRKEPDVITPNGFNKFIVKNDSAARGLKKTSRSKLKKVAESLFGYKLQDDALFVLTSGRYEFKNKGLDVFIDSLAKVNANKTIHRNIVAFIMVPGDVTAPREEVLNRLNGKDESKGPIYFPFVSHWMNNIEQDPILNMIKRKKFRNSKDEKVKIVFVPCYLNGNDGIFNMSYYDLMYGFDLSIFASYYEPWGYTPLESIAFSVPTITTSLAGFGVWAEKKCKNVGIDGGVVVVKRDDNNYSDVVNEISINVIDYACMSGNQRKKIALNAKNLSRLAYWSDFIHAYQDVYSLALNRTEIRNDNLLI